MVRIPTGLHWRRGHLFGLSAASPRLTTDQDLRDLGRHPEHR